LIDFSFEVGGRKVSGNRFADEIEKAMFQQVKDSVSKALSGVRCPEHGKYPSVVVKGSTLNNLHFEISGCCEDLIKRATAQLK
jgi:hypothetical protein